jgi:DNA polymerase III alpha subunit
VAHLDRLRGIFGERLAVDVHRHGERAGERLARALIDVAATRGVPVVATNDVRHATPGGRALLDVLTCIRLGTTLDAAGRRLLRNAERHLKTPAEMAALFHDLPAAIRESRRIAERCEFTLADLGYRFPDFPLPPGETPMGHLRLLTERGARERWGTPSERVRRQLAHELGMIERLDLAGYFLIVWDIVRFCRERGILCQGRGSAANSAVCYALGITAVDAVGMELLFERFLSEERGEWPDIDIDLPSGDRREDVIQYVYRRYGERGAGMTATVISYRTRSAVREAGKALGLSLPQVDRLTKLLRQHGWHDQHDELAAQLRAGGVDPDAPRIRLLVDCVRQMQGLPRHLGQHTGGMVIAAGRLDEVVPLEPAAMPGRNVIQWDKEDCTDLGLIKVDLLGLGMLAALEEAIPLVREHEGVALDLAHLPQDDPAVYDMLRRADTIGVFQVESRAQMATLPRMKPDHFYDLVVEVAIIRPGPIVGQMVHPYLARRNERAPVTYAHPLLEPILKRTLGVPLFQEQLLRMAMAVAGFSGGEAEELRRALGFRRSTARMEAIEERLRAGMATRGITGAVQEEIVTQITAFALYGFPECVVGDTRVIDADTGRLLRIEDAVTGRATLTSTIACDAEMRLRPRRVRKAIASGQRMVHRLRTADDREITASAEHPFLTENGWRNLGALREGDRLAVARKHELHWDSVVSIESAGIQQTYDLQIEGDHNFLANDFVVHNSHAASFALIAYASAYLKAHHPAAFACALLNCWPMGFYHPATVVKDAQRHGVAVLPIDAARSHWRCTIEGGPLRLGLRYVLGIRQEAAERLVAARPFASVAEAAQGGRLRQNEIDALAHAGAFAGLGLARREALWQAAAAERDPESLLARVHPAAAATPLPPMTAFEETAADYAATHVTAGPHVMAHLRDALRADGVRSAAGLADVAHGAWVRVAGHVIVRQRPGTAKGMCFLTLEDETGTANAFVTPPLYQRWRLVLHTSPLLEVEGPLERVDGVTHVRALRFRRLEAPSGMPDGHNYW